MTVTREDMQYPISGGTVQSLTASTDTPKSFAEVAFFHTSGFTFWLHYLVKATGLGYKPAGAHLVK